MPHQQNFLWDFTALVSPERRRQLLAIESFDDVIERVADGILISFKTEWRQGAARALFQLQVQTETYDAFFNAPHGYRAQYCVEPSIGTTQNRRLIVALRNACLNFRQTQGKPSVVESHVSASLNASRAKIWVTESDFPDVDEIHINYAPWVSKWERSNRGYTQDQAARAGAALGVLAPIGRILEIKGGWINSDGTEWFDPRKARRAEEIRDYGFS